MQSLRRGVPRSVATFRAEERSVRFGRLFERKVRIALTIANRLKKSVYATEHLFTGRYCWLDSPHRSEVAKLASAPDKQKIGRLYVLVDQPSTALKEVQSFRRTLKQMNRSNAE
jgi:hypothetical protein